MATWKRKPQEQEGKYRFSGRFFTTRGVSEALSQEEILEIYQEIKRLVIKKDGIDYLQVFVDEKERKLFFIDQLNDDMIASGQHPKEHDYCTLMFSHEYW